MAASLEQIAYKHLRGKLLLGTLQPGTALSEASLAREIGISRTPVRHALRQLEKEGLVVQVPRMGTFVKVPDRKEAQEAFHLRELLECDCARLAARHITDPQITELKRWCARYADAARRVARGGPEAYLGQGGIELVRADVGMHALIVRCAGNAIMARMIRDLRIATRTRMTDLHERLPWTQAKEKFARVADEHGRICDAICAHDATAARRAMRDHVRVARDTYLAQLDSIGDSDAPQITPAVRMLLAAASEDAWDDESDVDAILAQSPPG